MLRSAKSRARFALAQHCFAQKNSPKLFCPNAQFFHRYVFASHVASWCSAPLRIPPGGPFGHQKPPILPKSTTTGRVPILATRGALQGPYAQYSHQGSLWGLSAQNDHQGAIPGPSAHISQQGALRGPSEQGELPGLQKLATMGALGPK